MSKPKRKFSKRLLSMAEFENDGNGKSFQFQRGYKNKEGNWVNEDITLFSRDLLDLKELLDFMEETDSSIFESADSSPKVENIEE